ncbi:MAG: hypothetical protein Q7T18_00120 [Sedimentisphaerales bacterium]|nr:hypothetical protein [Sedimentisphaerales bacterium]
MQFKKVTAFTLTELVIAVSFLGILAYVAVPRMQWGLVDRYSGETLAQKIVTDLRLARTMAITEAARNAAGFAVTMTGSAPYSGYTITNLADATVLSSCTIDSTVSCSGGSLFKFGPLGNLLSGSGSTLVISSGGKSSTITVTSATGAVQCVEN